MIDEPRLRDGLARLLTATENNIRRRCEESPAVNQPLQDRYDAARKAGRTGLTFNIWREGEITQAGVAWLLACVFLRFLEDNDLLGEVYLAGPGDRTRVAQERQRLWYRANPNPRVTDSEYLLDIFAEIVRLPGMKGLLDRAHNPLWSLGPDGDGAKAIIDFFQSTDPDTGLLRHDFTDTARTTRFLGDVYQNISESARKRYALVQTPEFVVDFILDRTLTPATDEFGFEGLQLIDPACGSGHFLLAAFERIFPHWNNIGTDTITAAGKALDCIFGVDLNPYAVEIARFRLLVAALRACDISKLSNAPDWQLRVASGDSLLHGPLPDTRSVQQLLDRSADQLQHFYDTEDGDKVCAYLRQRFHVVVGNPPYITIDDDNALRQAYRSRFGSCSRDFQLSVPFAERFFALASHGDKPGYVGMITSSAFASRSFGKRLVERFLPLWDLTQIIDASGVYLPGQYGTPTYIIVGRNRYPVKRTLRAVRGIRGAEGEPADPANAPVWSEIRNHVDEAGFRGQYVSTAEVERSVFHRHPWSNGGGGAAELKQRIDTSPGRVRKQAVEIGRTVVLGEEEFWFTGAAKAHADPLAIPLVSGTNVREWQLTTEPAIYPYEGIGGTVVTAIPIRTQRRLWRHRTLLAGRTVFKRTLTDAGKAWYEVLEHYRAKLRPPLAITMGEIATHNHFVMDRGGKIFNRTAPVIKLREPANESDYISLTGALNSSLVCFWLRQVCFPKGGDHVGGEGARVRKSLWEERFAFDATKVSEIPLPASSRPLELANAIQAAADERSALLPAALAAREIPTRASLAAARERAEALLLKMIALQEELDWQVYHLYGLLDESLTLPIDQVPPIHLGERAFEIVMARAMESGELQTEWFARHRSTPRTTIPEHWPEPYRALVQRRLDTIARDRDIALIEQPEYKRRWNLPPWEELEESALRNWLLDRLEDARYWPQHPPALTSVARLADAVRHDAEFLQVAELYRHRADFELAELIEELVAKESVPFLPVLRYKETGLRKRADWEHTWQLQRREDAGEKVEIPVPPKYEKDDFLSADYWRLRGKLDVPKERFISYSPLVRDADKSLVIAWAGYDHGQQALALARYCYEMRGMEAWDAARLTPILAGLQELQPWLDQWHNQIDPETQQRLHEFVRSFVEGELAQLSLTAEQVRNWRPAVQAARAGRRKKS